jgi:putative transposase
LIPDFNDAILNGGMHYGPGSTRARRRDGVKHVVETLGVSEQLACRVRSDNGPEFIASAVQAWITAVGAKTAYITPGSLWENGYIESFNARLRDEFLNGEIFYILNEARILIEAWPRQYNTIRPHSSLGYLGHR